MNKWPACYLEIPHFVPPVAKERGGIAGYGFICI